VNTLQQKIQVWEAMRALSREKIRVEDIALYTEWNAEVNEFFSLCSAPGLNTEETPLIGWAIPYMLSQEKAVQNEWLKGFLRESAGAMEEDSSCAMGIQERGGMLGFEKLSVDEELSALSHFARMLTAYTDPNTGSMDNLFLEAIGQVKQKEDVTPETLSPIMTALLVRDRLLMPHVASILENPNFTSRLKESISKFSDPDYPAFHKQFEAHLGRSL